MVALYYKLDAIECIGMGRREILFRLHLTPYREAVLADGMHGSFVIGCNMCNLSIPARTALGVTGRFHPVDTVFKGSPDGVAR